MQAIFMPMNTKYDRGRLKDRFAPERDAGGIVCHALARGGDFWPGAYSIRLFKATGEFYGRSYFLITAMDQYLRFIFLLTPFFAISMFLAMTPGWELSRRRRLALQVGISALIVSLALLFFGRYLFALFGITVDSFRIGGGILLMLSGIGMVNSRPNDKLGGNSHKGAIQKDASAATSAPSAAPPPHEESQEEHDPAQIAVVPLAIPVTVGPATIATLLIMGAELPSLSMRLLVSVQLAGAVGTLTLMLCVAGWLERRLGRMGLTILSKMTGLILVAMASQMIATGVRALI